MKRGNKISALVCDNINKPNWKVKDLTMEDVGLWEPSFDTNLWQSKKILHLFVQKVGQGDVETTENIQAQEIKVLEWKPKH